MLMISETLLEQVKRKCYITDDSYETTRKVSDMVAENLVTVRRMIGVPIDFDFEAKGNEEELKLLKNYCWYDWNDSSNEFISNYHDDITSLHRKHEAIQYANKENE